MNEFRFTLSNQRRDSATRIGLWGMVVALLGIAIFSIYGPRVTILQLNVVLASLAALIVAGVIVLAYTLAFRHAWETLKRESSFVLTDDSLIYKRTGRPDVQIDLHEISGLYSQNKQLVVENAALHRRIVIPQEIEGFQTIYKRLARYKNVTTRPSYIMFRLAVPLIYGLCCALALWSRVFIVMTLAAVVGLVLIGLESMYLVSQMRHNQKQRYPIIIIVFEWLGAALVLYFRLSRP